MKWLDANRSNVEKTRTLISESPVIYREDQLGYFTKTAQEQNLLIHADTNLRDHVIRNYQEDGTVSEKAFAFIKMENDNVTLASDPKRKDVYVLVMDSEIDANEGTLYIFGASAACMRRTVTQDDIEKNGFAV